MPNSTSAWVMIAMMTTPKKVPTTLTWPPGSTAPPITGAAKEEISQSSPMVGWPICSRATSIMPAMAASRPEMACAQMMVLRDRDAGEFGRMRVAADGEDVPADAHAASSRYHMATADDQRGHEQPGIGPNSVVLPKAFTLSRHAVEGLRLGDAEVDALEDRRAWPA